MVLLALVLVSLTDQEDEFFTETIRIRIRMQSTVGGPPKTVAGEPSGMSRTSRPQSRLSKRSAGAGVDAEPETVQRTAPAPVSAAPPVPVSNLNADGTVLEGLSPPDPLAGIEVPADRQTDVPPARNDRWSVSWSNGRERAILSVPKLDEDALPEYTERLSGLLIAISVSPAGDVVSAEILPPGSGDIRIDRYLNSLALELVLEPGFAEDGDQNGILRLVVSEGSE